MKIYIIRRTTTCERLWIYADLYLAKIKVLDMLDKSFYKIEEYALDRENNEYFLTETWYGDDLGDSVSSVYYNSDEDNSLSHSMPALENIDDENAFSF